MIEPGTGRATAVDVVCTLFEGDYDRGAAALLNSLWANGFTGTVLCGYRGPAPWWADLVERWQPMTVRCEPQLTDRHFTAYKPALMQHCLERFGAQRVYYIDPDIVVEAPWSLLQAWATGGVAVAEDIDSDLRPRAPQRLRWRRYLADHGLPVGRELGAYFNAGFVGLDAAHAGFLATWEQVMALAEAELGTLVVIKTDRHPTDLFFTPDQDAMNMALEVADTPVHAMSRSAMGFDRNGPLVVPHAIGRPKPWQGGVLRRALHAHAPSHAHRAFVRHMDAPVPALPAGRRRMLRLGTKAAGFLTRFYARPVPQ